MVASCLHEVLTFQGDDVKIFMKIEVESLIKRIDSMTKSQIKEELEEIKEELERY